MEGKQNISLYRERLDKTLASHDLANEKTLKTLVKNQLLRSSQFEVEGYIDNILERRTMEVSNFLDMLRSASVNDDEVSKTSETPNAGWKLKQDNEEYRVMYREGPQGTPLHTLLVEGYVDGPIDVCLCVSWESVLYKKWWPQSSIPTFKIISSKCLQKVRIGEQISLVRMKVSWPLSAREALVNYFVFEYFQDGLIVVLLNTISDLESIDRSTHGFTNDGIPKAKDVVRIDVVGGFALQKVSPDRSYFRTIANMDVKLDFVPPSFINFISRQLIGNGFRLYQKATASVSKGDNDFSEALGDPLYARIREALYSYDKPKVAPEPEDVKSDMCILPEEHLIETMQDDVRDMDQNVLGDEHANESSMEYAPVINHKAFGEIEEEEIEESKPIEEDSKGINHPLTDQTVENCRVNSIKKFFISPEVEQALLTLERVISMVRKVGFNAQNRSPSGFTNEELPNLRKGAVEGLISSEDGGIRSDGRFCIEAPNKEIMERTSQESRNSSGTHNCRHTGSNSHSREVNHNRIAPASPEQNLPVPSETHQVALCSPENGTTGAPILDKTANGNKQVSTEANGIHEISLNEGKKLKQQKKHRLCCLHFVSGRLMA